MKIKPFLPALLMVTVISGCTPIRGGANAHNLNRDVITRIQIDELQANTAFEIVQRLRSDMLRTRGTYAVTRPSPPAVVYMDGLRRGLPEVLKEIAAADVAEIRFYTATSATQKWGSNHTGGAIEIKGRRPGGL